MMTRFVVALGLLWPAASDGGASDGTELSPADADKLRMRSKQYVDRCEWEMSPDQAAEFGAQSHDLGEGKTLYLIDCLRGAYQSSSLAFVADGDALNQVFFAYYGDEFGWGGTDLITSPEFDAAAKKLHSFAKARGIGDCGSVATYQWSEYGFKLLEYRYRNCPDDGAADGDSEMPEFPVIYKAK